MSLDKNRTLDESGEKKTAAAVVVFVDDQHFTALTIA